MEQASQSMEAQGAGGPPNLLDSEGLCLLSLDGGGVRGLSTLYILKYIMDQLNAELAKRSLPPRKPCEVFDLIGGTSTGGIIAIMLGRLEMTVDECITAYCSLAKYVFGQKISSVPFDHGFRVKARFSSSKLETAIRGVAQERGFTDETKLNDGTTRGCRTFVCAVNTGNKTIARIRTYNLPPNAPIPATIGQAARATSAASTFFDPIVIGGREFADGGLGANNPVDEVEDEAIQIWCSNNGRLQPLVKCFISIGTGKPATEAFEENIFKFLGKTVVEIATETEATEKKFIRRWTEHYDNNRYFRFNVDRGLQTVGLEEYDKLGEIESAVEEYLTYVPQMLRVRDSVRNLLLKQSKTNMTSLSLIHTYKFPTWRFPPLETTVERQNLLERIQVEFSKPGNRTGEPVVVLAHGLGGSGKTYLSLQYAKLWLQSHTNFYFFEASSLDALFEGFLEFAEDAKIAIPGISGLMNATDGSALNARAGALRRLRGKVLEYFENLQEEWLIIFDNYDLNADDFSDLDIREFTPRSSFGKIIITTRNAEAGNDINGASLITIGPMSQSEAVSLLELTARLPHEPNNSDLDELKAEIALETLASLPLAIVQVGAYIRTRMKSGSAQSRLEQYRRTYNEQDVNIKTDAADVIIGKQYSIEIIKSFNISLRAIKSSNRAAAELLLLFGLFHHSRISRDFFAKWHEFKSSLAKVDKIDVSQPSLKWIAAMMGSRSDGSWDDQEFRDAMSTLESYSLIFKAGPDVWSLHPLVHAWTRARSFDLNREETWLISTDDLHQASCLVERCHIALSILTRYLPPSRRIRDPAYLSATSQRLHYLSWASSPIVQNWLERSTLPNAYPPAHVLDMGMFLSEFRDAQRTSTRMILLALASTAVSHGLDDMTTLTGLRLILSNIDVAYNEVKARMFPAMLDHLDAAADADEVYTATTQKAVFYMTEATFLPHNLFGAVKRLLTYLDENRESLHQGFYLSTQVMAFSILGTLAIGMHNIKTSGKSRGLQSVGWKASLTDDEEREILQYFARFDHLLYEVESSLGEADFCTLQARLVKALHLHTIGQDVEAFSLAESVRALIVDQKLPYANLLESSISFCKLFHFGKGDSEKLLENLLLLYRFQSTELGKWDAETITTTQQVMTASDSDNASMLSFTFLGNDRTTGLEPAFAKMLEVLVAFTTNGESENLRAVWSDTIRASKRELEFMEGLAPLCEALKAIGVHERRMEHTKHAHTIEKCLADTLNLNTERKLGLEKKLKVFKELATAWETLSALFDQVAEAADLEKIQGIGQRALLLVENAPREAKAAILYLINMFAQFSLLKSSAVSKRFPFQSRVLERLRDLDTFHFGSFESSYQTAFVSVILIICYRLEGKKSDAMALEDQLVRQRIAEASKTSRTTSDEDGQRSYLVASVAMEHLHLEYERREWYEESLRLLEVVLDAFTNSLGPTAEETVSTGTVFFGVCGNVSSPRWFNQWLSKFDDAYDVSAVTQKAELVQILTKYQSQAFLRGHTEMADRLNESVLEKRRALPWPIQQLMNKAVMAKAKAIYRDEKILRSKKREVQRWIDKLQNGETISEQEMIQLFMLAIAMDDVESISQILDLGVDINISLSLDGSSPLHLSIHWGSVCALRLLLDRGANKEYRDRNGYSASQHSALTGSRLVMEALYEAGADFHIVDAEGSTIIHFAAQSGDPDKVHFLLDHEMPEDRINAKGISALDLACAFGYTETVMLLFARSKQLDREWPYFLRALGTLVQSGQYNIVKQLFAEHPLEVKRYMKEYAAPLLHHVYNSSAREDLIPWLFENGFEIGWITPEGMTSLIATHFREGRLDVLKALAATLPNELHRYLKGQATAVLNHFCNTNPRQDILHWLFETGFEMEWVLKTNTILSDCCRKGRLEIVQTLAQHNVNLPACLDDDGISLLTDTCTTNNSQTRDMIAYLISQEVPVDAIKEGVWGPIHACAETKEVELAEFIIQQGANVNARGRDGVTALHWTCWKDDLAMAKMLISHHADVNIRDNYGQTPLYVASKEGKADIVALLLEAGADVAARAIAVNKDPEYLALHVSIMNGQPDVVKILLSHGADPRSCDGDGFSPLSLAISTENIEIIRLLLNRPDVIRDEVTIVPSAGDQNKRWLTTPLIASCVKRSTKLLELFAREGCDINETVEIREKVGDGVGPRLEETFCLALCSELGWLAGVKLLVEELQAKVNQQTSEALFTALREASAAGHEPIVAYLLEHGAEINLVDHTGQSALHWACAKDQTGVVELLLDKGADTTLQTTDGLTALELAIQMDHSGAADLLTVSRKGRSWCYVI